MTTPTPPTVWFLTGSQGLYGPETLAQVEQQSRALVDQLNECGALPLPVVWQPVLTDSTAIHEMGAQQPLVEVRQDVLLMQVHVAWRFGGGAGSAEAPPVPAPSRDDSVLRHLDAVASGGLCYIQRLVSRAQ